MRFPRSSGILLHITSLPSEIGVGDLGESACKFVDFLTAAGQRVWQVLPLNPPAHGDSPYSCYSVFAGNPLLINLQQLIHDGWLAELPDRDSLATSGLAATGLVSSHAAASEGAAAGDRLASGSQQQTEFGIATEYKLQVLQVAYSEARSRLDADEDFAAFCSDNAWWLSDFARFEALMRHFATADWASWPAGLVQRTKEALAEWDQRLAAEIEFSKFVQFVFEQQWRRLKQYANEREVRMYGDLSFYVARESADVWANQSLFHLDDNGSPTVVAGVPPDYFSETGQRWGNPLYRWDVMESNGFAWWTGRFRRARDQFDLLRVDHFRGFESYWEIPAHLPTAEGGEWRSGPGVRPFEAARAALGELAIIAEDLGMITQQVHDLRDQLNFPPMRVLQFGFDQEHDDFHRPNRYPEHSVAYTGTHDNDTTVGWLNSRAEDSAANELLHRYVPAGEGIHLRLVELVLESPADTAIIPLQDLLGLGSEARMNTPGTATGNWQWQVDGAALTTDLAEQLSAITKQANR